MNTKWSNGRHNYFGKYNSRSQRKVSKIYKGIVVNTKELEEALSRISNGYGVHPSSQAVQIHEESSRRMVRKRNKN